MLFLARRDNEAGGYNSLTCQRLELQCWGNDSPPHEPEDSWSWTEARPHPSPLPQEREKRSQRLGEIGRSVGSGGRF
jgi:hypothetical protein